MSTFTTSNKNDTKIDRKVLIRLGENIKNYFEQILLEKEASVEKLCKLASISKPTWDYLIAGKHDSSILIFLKLYRASNPDRNKYPPSKILNGINFSLEPIFIPNSRFVSSDLELTKLGKILIYNPDISKTKKYMWADVFNLSCPCTDFDKTTFCRWLWKSGDDKNCLPSIISSAKLVSVFTRSQISYQNVNLCDRRPLFLRNFDAVVCKLQEAYFTES